MYHFNRTGVLHIYKSQILQNGFILMVPNALLFIPTWQIHHELDLGTSEFIRRQSSVLFILTWSILHHFPSSLRKSVSNFRKILTIHSPSHISMFFSHFIIFFVFISMSPFPPRENSQLLPINSIFLRIHNFLLNSEKCGLYKRFKLLLCDVNVIKRPLFISLLKNVKWTYSFVALKSAIFVRSQDSRVEEPWVIPVTERVTLRGRLGPERIERKDDSIREGSESEAGERVGRKATKREGASARRFTW